MFSRALQRSLPKFDMAGQQPKILSIKSSIIAKQGMMKMILKLDMEDKVTGVQQVNFSEAHNGGTC